ncbi:alpha/beta fold hydrolase [Nocardioides sp.]|uniref:alpha/beta hydrolase n=1 Tax=Nocardioides sp. TaxID=35761 RepID=UPI00262EEED1|nr:alpha/beta fold hydrolase [Nocardioides sp.]
MLTRTARLLGGVLVTSVLAVVPSTGDATAAPVGGAAAGSATAKPAPVTTVDGCIKSKPEPGTKAKIDLCYTYFKPAGANRRQRVPMIMHSHGWGGSRTESARAFKTFTDAGYGVLSFDQRGFGESGGHAHVEDPTLEGVDVRKLVRLVSELRWVQQDGRGDPRLGAIGGSYGGGYQFVGAFEELRVKGKPVFDALAPEITWNDVSDSLAPEGVVRTEWALLLSAASVPTDALPTSVYKALLEGAATGTYPDGSLPGTEDLVTFFEKNGPRWHVDHGRRLPIPVLFGQGTTDGLFPLQQGLRNWRTAITKQARKQSIFVAYNGGHVLPSVLPQGVNVTSDPCSKRLTGGDFEKLSIRFFDEQLKGRDRGLGGYGKLHLATAANDCVTVKRVKATRSVDLGTVASTTAAGAPIPYEIAEGPVTVAGTPYLTGDVTALGVQNRAFYGLAIGASPLDAHLVQNNVLPLSEDLPVTGVARRIDLPSVSVRVPKGQHLYLLASPISDTFVGMGSRVPGLITIADTTVHLPVVRR